MTASDSEPRPLRVVVVDDEEDVRLVLSMQLDAEPDIHVVGDAADGAEAVARCLELEPDVVVMDLLMPRVSGFEAIERLQEKSPQVAIVAYTGVAGDFVRTEMERLDIPLVLKTGNPRTLINAVRRAASRP